MAALPALNWSLTSAWVQLTDGPRGRAVLDQIDPQLQRLGGLRRRDVLLVAAVGPHERQELPRALVVGRRGERDAVLLARGELPGRGLQLVPGRGRRDAGLVEDVLVVEQPDRVGDRLQAVDLALVRRGVDHALRRSRRRTGRSRRAGRARRSRRSAAGRGCRASARPAASWTSSAAAPSG